MKIAIAGTGYVGLVTGVTLAHLGHEVWCVDVDQNKINDLKSNLCPIYEPGLEELMKENSSRIHYTIDYKDAYRNADAIYIGVGTPERKDGSANLDYIMSVCNQIIESVIKDIVVIIKSTVPIGTNDQVEKYLKEKMRKGISVDVVSNPEFLAQGTAVHDTLYASRIVIGAESLRASEIAKEIYKPLTVNPYNVPLLLMSRRSAEMVKYASNDFLALKISYINEISNLCEALDANIEDVAKGMSFDSRIGSKFLNAGIGYGGSCFPKDTKALHFLSKEMGKELTIVKACIEVNKKQKAKLIPKMKKDLKSLKDKNIGILGLTFKPETDDLRESPAIENVRELLDKGCIITAYDPVGMNNFKKLFGDQIVYAKSLLGAIKNMDAVMILTEWNEFKEIDPKLFKANMKNPNVYDGRNCFDINQMKKSGINYKSMGR